MSHYEGDWKLIPEFVEWVDSLKTWAKEYEIYKWIGSENGSPSSEDEQFLSSIDENLIWTEETGNRTDFLHPGLVTGDWGSGGVLGWYIARKPCLDGDLEFETQKYIDCPACGNGEKLEPEECEAIDCEDGQVFLYLQDTDFTMVPE